MARFSRIREQTVSYSCASEDSDHRGAPLRIAMALATLASFVDGILQSQILDAEQCDEVRRLQSEVESPRELAQQLLRRDWLTAFQVNQIFQGNGGGLTLGPYILLERLGEGGMGQVFKARQKLLNRVVALKVIRKECLNNPKVIQRFQREIRAAGQLSHPHIVRAFDADQVGGTYYIALEHIDGVDLAKLVKDNGPLPVNQACEYIRQAALGLQHAFERGLIHRDLKPANLLVTRGVAADRRRSSGVMPRPVESVAKQSSGMLRRSEAALHYPWGVVKILDMGLARCTNTSPDWAFTHLTLVGSVMGTPEFIAPEQARDPHNSDIRADIYSLGCTLYFLLTGQPPFPNGTMTEKLLQHQFNEPDSAEPVRRERLQEWAKPHESVEAFKKNVHVPVLVDGVLQRLLAKSPDDRYQTPIELADELASIVRKMADGTLEREEELAKAATPMADPPPSPARPSAQPMIHVTPPSFPGSSAGKLAMLSAALGGLAVMFCLTVFAVLLSAGAFSRAHSSGENQPKTQLKADDGNVKK
jgi:serine/threonine protein kinase